jgi:excisionase family DNA binding protein
VSSAPQREQATLLSVEQVALLCGLSRRAVYDAIKRGELRAIRLCSRLRIGQEDLERWFAGSSVQPIARPPATSRPARSSKPSTSGSFRAQLRASGEARQ